VTQDEINYANHAQMRVAAETRCLEALVTLQTDASGHATLPADVVRLLAVNGPSGPLVALSADELLAHLSGSPVSYLVSSYAIWGRELYLLPAAAQALTVAYARLPAPLTSDDEFEVNGEYEDLVDDLAVATTQLDTGETAIAAQALARYDQRAQRLAARAASAAAPIRFSMPVWGDPA
jgi:hypothetical protein